MDLTTSCGSLKFPQLAPRYQGMPRRYEETKPVIIQDFTHRKILGIGHDIQSKVFDRLEREKTQAMEATEIATWERAEKKKHSAVKRVRDEAAKKMEHSLKEQRKEHEKNIKEEVVRVEMAMQKMAIEQVQEERARGEKILAETVKQIEERCACELEQAVKEARAEEQQIAAEETKKLIETHNAQVEKLTSEHVVEKAQALALLTSKKDKEREEAVKKAHEYEQRVTKDIVSKLKMMYEKKVSDETSKIEEKLAIIEKLTREIEEIQLEKDRLAKFLAKTRTSFQDFIDRVQKVRKGEADFMLPPAYIEEIERGLQNAD